MAAGVTRTISSAILIFELTGGLQHVLPILVAVITAYIIGTCYSVSVFDSILKMKGLITMPEFNRVETYHKTAEQVMIARSQCLTSMDTLLAVKLAGKPILERCFHSWANLAMRRREQVATRVAPRVYEGGSYAAVQQVLDDAHADDEYYAYVDSGEVLLGVLHRSNLVTAVGERRNLWFVQQAAQHSMRGASARAYGALDRTLTAQSGVVVPDAKPPRVSKVRSFFTSKEERRGSYGSGRPLFGGKGKDEGKIEPFDSSLEVKMDEINSIQVLAEESIQQGEIDIKLELAEESMNAALRGSPSCLRASPHSGVPQSPLSPGFGSPESSPTDVPPGWMHEPITGASWDGLGLDTAPFTVQAQAPMSLVHFYFSQLTLNCVFVVDKGLFVGMINKKDMMRGDL